MEIKIYVQQQWIDVNIEEDDNSNEIKLVSSDISILIEATNNLILKMGLSEGTIPRIDNVKKFFHIEGKINLTDKILDKLDCGVIETSSLLKIRKMIKNLSAIADLPMAHVQNAVAEVDASLEKASSKNGEKTSESLQLTFYITVLFLGEQFSIMLDEFSPRKTTIDELKSKVILHLLTALDPEALKPEELVLFIGTQPLYSHWLCSQIGFRNGLKLELKNMETSFSRRLYPGRRKRAIFTLNVKQDDKIFPLHFTPEEVQSCNPKEKVAAFIKENDLPESLVQGTIFEVYKGFTECLRIRCVEQSKELQSLYLVEGEEKVSEHIKSFEAQKHVLIEATKKIKVLETKIEDLKG
eukprot:snap_masked-scaffold_7-processed-gene-9.19-mRNA-1 protein AED:1.00 eAED:1.00 QI:0/-1/0/0/-1/1/1/0/353